MSNTVKRLKELEDANEPKPLEKCVSRKKVRKRWNHTLKEKLRLVAIEIRYHKSVLTNKKLSLKVRFKHFLSMITRRCSGKGHRCGGGWAYLAHSNCAYHEKLSNYSFCCKECHQEINDMYQEMWDEYNSERF